MGVLSLFTISIAEKRPGRVLVPSTGDIPQKKPGRSFHHVKLKAEGAGDFHVGKHCGGGDDRRQARRSRT